MRGAPASLENSEVTLFYRSEIIVGTAVTELGSLNTMGKSGGTESPKTDVTALMTEPKQ